MPSSLQPVPDKTEKPLVALPSTPDDILNACAAAASDNAEDAWHRFERLYKAQYYNNRIELLKKGDVFFRTLGQQARAQNDICTSFAAKAFQYHNLFWLYTDFEIAHHSSRHQQILLQE